ncbi:MAG: hypothetical protein EA388_01085 [Nitriliruptor sp.]|nr:MAG: hypothetical protein EA388_01085 [Nitriliruptor sp.]
MNRHTRLPASPSLVAMTVTLATLLLTPMSSTVRWATAASVRLRDEEDGVSEVVSGLLLAGGIALIVIVVLGIIQPWAENEANNLPTSGG